MAQELVHKLKYTVPRKLYPTPARAVVEGKAIARVDIPLLRKMRLLVVKRRVFPKSKLYYDDRV